VSKSGNNYAPTTEDFLVVTNKILGLPMLRFLQLMSDVYALAAPQQVLSQKMQQMRTGDNQEHLAAMEGTVAQCQVDPVTGFLVKTVRVDKKDDFVSHLQMVKTMCRNFTVRSWAEAAPLEFSTAHEFAMLGRFWCVWQPRPKVEVPQPVGVTPTTITMSFCRWPRFADCGLLPDAFWENLHDFFFQSIVECLLHGDISAFNVLAEPISGNICVVDFGLSLELTPGQALEILTDERQSPMAVALHEMWFKCDVAKWKREITPEWWEGVVRFSNVSSGDRHSGLYARSLVNMTQMFLSQQHVRK
jgi:hypothetical protein